MISKTLILNIRNLSLLTFVFLVFFLLFFILFTPLALAGSCTKLTTDDYGPCAQYCTDVSIEEACGQSPNLGWSTASCDTFRKCGAAPTSGSTGASSEGLPNPLGTTDISTLIGNVIKALLGVTGSIALLMFIYGGILWLVSGGNEKRVEQGKSVLTWATIGLGIIFTSYILVNFVIKSLTSGGVGTGQTSALDCKVTVCNCTDGSKKCSDKSGVYEVACKPVCGS